MVHGLGATALQNIGETDQIAVDISGGILEGVADTRLGRKIHHHIKMWPGEETCHGLPIGKIHSVELKVWMVFQMRQAIPLEGGVIRGAEVIKTVYDPPFGQQTAAQVVADEAPRTGDENPPAHEKACAMRMCRQ